jgi:uncharacterized membrane protein YdfJ with MMPL/SSD domain
MVVTLVIVFAIVGLSFRSLVVPFRAVITIMFTLVIVFGASVLVYQVRHKRTQTAPGTIASCV